MTGHAPEVRAFFCDVLAFWSDRGVDGFRIDVAHGLAKDLDRDDLDDYVVWCTNDQPEDGSHPVIDRDEVHDIYHEWRKVFNEYNPPRFAVAEAWVVPEHQHLYASMDELGQSFNFDFAQAVSFQRGTGGNQIANRIRQSGTRRNFDRAVQ